MRFTSLVRPAKRMGYSRVNTDLGCCEDLKQTIIFLACIRSYQDKSFLMPSIQITLDSISWDTCQLSIILQYRFCEIEMIVYNIAREHRASQGQAAVPLAIRSSNAIDILARGRACFARWHVHANLFSHDESRSASQFRNSIATSSSLISKFG